MLESPGVALASRLSAPVGEPAYGSKGRVRVTGESFRPRQMQFGDAWVVVTSSAFPDSRGGFEWHPPVAWKFWRQ